MNTDTLAPRPTRVVDAGAVTETCDKCERGIRYFAVMSNGQHWGLNCAGLAPQKARSGGGKAHYDAAVKELRRARYAEWSADPRNAVIKYRVLSLPGNLRLMTRMTNHASAGTLTGDTLAQFEADVAAAWQAQRDRWSADPRNAGTTWDEHCEAVAHAEGWRPPVAAR